MGRGHSGTRIFSQFSSDLGFNLDAENEMLTGDVSDVRFTNQVKKIALDYLRNGVTAKNINHLKSAVLDYYRKLQGSKLCWGWKFPETYLIGPLVLEVFPNARFLHIVRDGRDIAFKRHQTDRPDRPLGKWILGHMHVLEQPHHIQAAASWKFQVDSFDQWKINISTKNLLEVTFEHFIQYPVDAGKEIAGFLNRDFSADNTTSLEESINIKKVSQYKEQKARDLADIEAVIGDTLRRWHYIA